MDGPALYSIQNSGGEVYGHYALPEESTLTLEEWRELLIDELAEFLGINGIAISDYITGDERIDRIVIDIDPFRATDDNVERVHIAVGLIALMSQQSAS